jgi:hypothetical protein
VSPGYSRIRRTVAGALVCFCLVSAVVHAEPADASAVDAELQTEGASPETASALHAPGQADADADAGETPDAASERLFREGRKLLGEGEQSEACERFDESLKLKQSPGTLLNVASCHEHRGDFVGSMRHFEAALRLARSEPDGVRREAWIKAAEAHATRLRKRVGAVFLGPGVTETMRITIDGDSLRRAEMPLLLNPGRYSVVVEVPGRPPTRRILDVTEGAHLEIGPPGDAPASEAQAVSATPPITQPGAEPAPPNRTVGWSLVGAGAGALGGALILGAIVWSEESRLDRECAAAAADGRRGCPKSVEPTLERARTLRTTADVVGLLGLVAAGVGITLLLNEGAHQGQEASRPLLRAQCQRASCEVVLSRTF